MAAKLLEFPVAETSTLRTGDPELAEAARSGDRTAFTELIRRHQGTVRGMMRRLTGGQQADADDLAQMAFLQAWRRIDTFRGGTFRSWICAIGYREFLQQKRRARLTEPLDIAGAETSTFTSASVRYDTDRAIAGLPDTQRVAIILSLAVGMSHGEISAATGWPLGTVKSHINRAKAALRQTLAAYGAA